MSTAAFEYKNKNTETPFETFLRYTDEKQKSAIQLAKVLEGTTQKGSQLLDVGAGNGEFLQLALSKLSHSKDLSLTLVEPSDDLIARLKQNFVNQPDSNLRIIHSDLQNFSSDNLYDIILMSHLFYHIPRSTWGEQLDRALSLLSPNGKLIVVLREKDDVYDFKMAFKPILFNKEFKPLTIDDVLTDLPKAGNLEIKKHLVESELKIPVGEKPDDAESIIEFYLNKSWQEFPEQVKKASLEFIKDRGNTFNQIDCIAVIEKLT